VPARGEGALKYQCAAQQSGYLNGSQIYSHRLHSLGCPAFFKSGQARLSDTEQQISGQLFKNPHQTQKRYFKPKITKTSNFNQKAKNARIAKFINFIKMA
jgi:hypothetical protein